MITRELDMKITSRAGRVTAAFLIGCLMLPQSLWAQDPSAMAREGAVDENPHWGAMVGDFFVARPLGLVMTVGGTASGWSACRSRCWRATPTRRLIP